ncbi:MAG TPA: hypothetical protein DCF44_03345 [Chitinophagaceae bacterium]|nr:hypothetical protein [Chitinophagaceae bacterium]
MRLFSRIFFIAALIIGFVYTFFYGYDKYTFYGDAVGYYSYLPSIFIYDNLGKVDSIPTNMQIPSDVEWAMKYQREAGLKSESGHIINQYTCGMAILEWPFFMMAHASAKILDQPVNAYSWPYDYSIKLSSFVYLLLGFFFTYRILRRKVSSPIALITLALLLLGSNLFWFSFEQAGMSHIPMFFLYATFIWFTLKIHDAWKQGLNFSWLHFIALGVSSGMMVLIRPSDIILLLIFPLFGLTNLQTLQQKWKWMQQSWKGILLAAICAFVVWIPQLWYWKTFTGHWFFDSYKGQSFDWSFKHYLDGLFGGSNGWLMYSPLMILSLFGLLLREKLKNWVPGIPIIFVLYTFIIYSWWCYFYINGFGSRPMIHMYALLAIPLSLVIEWLFAKRNWMTWLLGIFILLSLWLNIHFSILQHEGFLITENSSLRYNLSMLFKSQSRIDQILLLDLDPQPDESTMQFKRVLTYSDYNDSVKNYFRSDVMNGSPYFIRIPEGDEFGPEMIRYSLPEGVKEGQWLKCSGRFLNRIANLDTYMSPKLVLEIKLGQESIAWQGTRIANKIGKRNSRDILQQNKEVVNQWGEVSFFVQLPAKVKPGDECQLKIWNLNRYAFDYDDLKIEWWQ